MKRFMAWLGFVSVTDMAPPVPGRRGDSVWDEMVAEFELPTPGPWLADVDWAAA